MYVDGAAAATAQRPGPSGYVHGMGNGTATSTACLPACLPICGIDETCTAYSE